MSELREQRLRLMPFWRMLGWEEGLFNSNQNESSFRRAVQQTVFSTFSVAARNLLSFRKRVRKQSLPYFLQATLLGRSRLPQSWDYVWRQQLPSVPVRYSR